MVPASEEEDQHSNERDMHTDLDQERKAPGIPGPIATGITPQDHQA